MIKRKVILDCDPGIDDTLALLTAINAPELEIVGITLVDGNVCVEKSIKNVARLMTFLGVDNLPIYVQDGSKLLDDPDAEKFERVEYYEDMNAEDTHGEDGLGNTKLPFSNEILKKNLHTEISASRFIYETIKADTKNEIDIICLGPLTNLGNAMLIDHNILRNRNLFVMGGTYKVHGNCNPLSEFNFWFDHVSANRVIEKSKANITMFPLDVTRRIVLTDKIIDVISHFDVKISDFVKKITKFYMNFHLEQERIEGCVINDPLIVVSYLNRNIYSFFNANVEVYSEEFSTIYGACSIDRFHIFSKEDNCSVANKVDVNEFYILFISYITKTDVDLVRQYVIENKLDFNFDYPYDIFGC